jgi:hypothetical protein
MVSGTALETLPRLPRAITYAGKSRQATGATIERKVPSARAVTCHDVLPVRPPTVIVTNSPMRKPAPHTVAPPMLWGAATIAGWQRRIRAGPV